ncbi:MAG: T9SS type A sorting domain-containing protein [Flavobacterium sp.]|uniref:T9SS type A sorting domain-containing protein n=1 Tax=Flavobacterium sp. TaxID=239 RepID=UPI0022BE6F9F|nr:leucine-rich repeat domain-containing protein [Flavobacterium sp.]MCZ8196493.1 T9SS type A sorting domain-containing protein [Flavobacterium sp.]
MKKYYFLIVGFLFFGVANAQVVNIPDTFFKMKLIEIGIDSNNDNEIQVSEALATTILDVSYSSIADLTGIEEFVNLQDLNCAGNELISLNIDQLTSLLHLDINGNQITNLNLNELTNLTILSCPNNQISYLDLSGLTNLETLNCEFNQLASLDLSELINLHNINCNFNQISTINFSGLVNIEEIICKYNSIQNLSLVGMPNLKHLECNVNIISNLDLTGSTAILEWLDCSSNNLTTLDLTTATNLKGLLCSGSPITSLNISGLSELESVDCSYCSLSNLDINGLDSLYYLNCDNNLFTNLDFLNVFTSLAEFHCANNQLSSLDFSGIGFGFLDCSHNQLTSLILSDVNILKCSYNQLTSIDLSSVYSLQSLSCDNNQLTNLSVEHLQIGGFMEGINCSTNQLISLNIKNGTVENELNFSGNPNLQYICSDDDQLASIENKLVDYGYTNCNVNSYCSFVPGGYFYSIQGNVKYDNEFDGCDAFDNSYPNLKFNISSQSSSGSFITNSSGNYMIPVSSGTHTITPVLENPSSFTIFPTSLEVSFPNEISNLIVQDFCVTSVPINDLEITLLPLNIVRPGFDSKYKIVYKNKGNQTQSGTLDLSFNDAVLDLVISNPFVTSQSTNNLSWDFSDLQPFETREILVTLNLNSPLETPPVNAGYVLNYTATISGATDETPLDNISTVNQTVVNSFDPNDKTCLEGATITPNQVGKEVHYMIRFENTGTANAQNIVVKDMINTTKFDVNSLIPISGSHPFVTRITNTNKVEFIFENIQLPFDDANNDGYVAFKIKTKPNLILGNTFSNTASIYFDYNFPIVTNTATTTVSNVLTNQDFEFAYFISINPNPAKETLTINAQNIEVSSISIYNTLGQLVQVIPNAKEIKTIDVSQLKSGNYFIKVISDKGMSSSKFIKE